LASREGNPAVASGQLKSIRRTTMYIHSRHDAPPRQRARPGHPTGSGRRMRRTRGEAGRRIARGGGGAGPAHRAGSRRSRACASRRIHATPARVTTGTATVPSVTPAPSSRLPIVTTGTAMVPTRTFSYATCIVRWVRDRWKRTSKRHQYSRPRAQCPDPAIVSTASHFDHRSRQRTRTRRGVVTRQQLLREVLSRRMIARRIGASHARRRISERLRMNSGAGGRIRRGDYSDSIASTSSGRIGSRAVRFSWPSAVTSRSSSRRTPMPRSGAGPLSSSAGM
jgi:hypothetical protein